MDLMDDNQVITQLIATYEEMRGGYATADATVSMQSISPLFILLITD